MADFVSLAAIRAATAKVNAAKGGKTKSPVAAPLMTPQGPAGLSQLQKPPKSLDEFDSDEDEAEEVAPAEGSDAEGKRERPRTEAEIQRRQLERLMAKPEKAVVIPERRDKKGYKVREFMLDVMGSSSGAGSGEFHVYRAARRREMARQQFVLQQDEEQRILEEYQRQRQERETKALSKTEKKRLMRQRRKQLKKYHADTGNGADKQSGSDADEGEESGADTADEKTATKRARTSPPPS